MGLPILGYIHNMQTISKDMIENYHRENYVGSNIILVAAGPINHNELVEATQKYIKAPKRSESSSQKSLIKPKFNPGVSGLELHK